MIKIKTVITILFMLCPVFGAFAEDINAVNGIYAANRLKMVQEQLAARDIKDKRVLEAMSVVERQKFLPEAMREHAYEDVAIAVNEGRILGSPYSIAYAAQVMQLNGSEKILQIGIEVGYQAAVLAMLAKEVYCVEPSEILALQAEGRLRALGFKNIKVKTGDIYNGWQEYAPYDDIVTTEPLSFIPQQLIEQVKTGGKIVISLGDKNSNKLFVAQKQTTGKLKQDKMVGTLVGTVIQTKKQSAQEEPVVDTSKPVPPENKKWVSPKNSRWKVRQY